MLLVLRDCRRVLCHSKNVPHDLALRRLGQLDVLVLHDWRPRVLSDLMAGGFWQGWQWNNPSIPFIDTVVALKPVWTVRFFSGILMFLGITTFLYNMLATVLSGSKTETVKVAA